MDTRLEQGAEVFFRLWDRAFRDAWKRLYEQCRWATGGQDMDFVDSWYRTYLTKYTPVMLSAVGTDGKLLGLLALALCRAGSGLVGAGGVQSEYQVWLALPDTSDEFMEQALRNLQTAFPRHTLHLRYLPHGTPLDGVRSWRAFGRHYMLTAHTRPYMKIDPAEIAKSLGRKTNKNLMSRL